MRLLKGDGSLVWYCLAVWLRGYNTVSFERSGQSSFSCVLPQRQSGVVKATLKSGGLPSYGKAITAQGKEGAWGGLFVRWPSSC